MFERNQRRHWHWLCSRCRQTTVTSGTIDDSSKLPLTTWLLAMPLLTQSRNNVAALELRRHLGVSCRTAWLMKQKLMQVMVDRDEDLVLTGRAEIDDAYLGGERPGTVGRGSENKVPFVAAMQTKAEGMPQKVCFKAMRFTKQAIQVRPIGRCIPTLWSTAMLCRAKWCAITRLRPAAADRPRCIPSFAA